jgi:putative ABC transport system permease protein
VSQIHGVARYPRGSRRNQRVSTSAVGGPEGGPEAGFTTEWHGRAVRGAIGVANIMVISVHKRRSEIGLCRTLGASLGQIRSQFLSEAILLALAGGVASIAAGALTTAVYAFTEGWIIVVATTAWAGGFGATLMIGAVAGLLPAIRAAHLSPTDALRTL